MKRFSERAVPIAATVAALAWASPGQAQTSTQGVVPVQVPAFPTQTAEVAALCNLDTAFAVGRLLIAPVANGVFQGPVAGYLDETLQVSIASGGSAFEDLTALSQRAGTPGIETVVAGTGPTDPANVYCYVNTRSDSGILTPKNKAPTRLEVYWSRGPCLLSNDDVGAACAAYNGSPPGDPALQPAHYLQEHLVAPEEPINICGCPFNDGTGVVQRIAEFCDGSLPPGTAGACPTGEGGLTGLETQATVTSGTETCQRVTIGGRSVFIGDSC